MAEAAREQEPQKRTQATKARGNGEGSIYKTRVNGKEVWRAAYRVPYEVQTDDGPRRAWKSIVGTSPSRTEAIERRRAALERWEEGGRAPVWRGERPLHLVAPPAPVQPVVPERLPVADLLHQWLTWKTGSPEGTEAVGANMARMYRRSIELHVLPALGDLDAREVSRQQLSKFLTQTLAEKKAEDGSPLLGPSPKRQIRNILTGAWRWAKDEELLEENVAVRLPNFRKPVRKDEGLERKAWQIQRMLKYVAGTDQEARWALRFATGMRQSEQLGITWDCFSNLAGKDKRRPMRLEIKQQLWRHPDTGRLMIKPETKTRAGTRIIPLSDHLAEVIREHKRRQDEQRRSPDWDPSEGMEGLVFTTPRGRPILQQLDNKQFKSLFNRAINVDTKTGKLRHPGDAKYVAPLRPHAARHLAISAMIAAGVSPTVVQHVVGHAEGGAVLRQVYLHLSWVDGMQAIEAATEKMYDEVTAQSRRQVAALSESAE